MAGFTEISFWFSKRLHIWKSLVAQKVIFLMNGCSISNFFILIVIYGNLSVEVLF